MDKFILKVAAVKKIWSSDDGKRSIWAIKGGDGKEYRTFSEKIAAGKDREFEVVSYEKPGRNGVETFVKSAPRDDGAGMGGNSGGGYSGRGAGRNDGGASERMASMALSYAKDVAVAIGTDLGGLLAMADGMLAWLKDRSGQSSTGQGSAGPAKRSTEAPRATPDGDKDPWEGDDNLPSDDDKGGN